MSYKFPVFKPLVLALSISLAACGGGGSGDDDDSAPAARTLSGTAAAGAALIGTVTVKGALGNTRSALIEADGSYEVDVTGLTAPYRLRASGTVGGKTYKLHSYAEEADVGGNVNITPFTDLIIANAAQQLAESFFDSNTATSLDPAEVDAQEAALQAKLQDVFDAIGVGTAIDLLNTSFSADHTGLDAALDVIRVEVDTATNIATITNLVDNTTLADNVLDTEDNTDTLDVVDAGGLTEAVGDIQAIANLFDDFASQFAVGLPSAADIQDLLAADFLQHDQSKGLFITDITTDPTIIGLGFTGVSVVDLDSGLGEATVKFNASFDGEVDPETETWYVAKDTNGAWQLRGNQAVIDINSLGFHCNDFDGTDNSPGGCGINVSFWDEDFTNTGGLPIASGTMRIFDPSDLVTPKVTVYLGTPDFVAPGELQIYNVPEGGGNGFYTGDWRAFGTGVNEIDPAVFAVGDVIEYRVYTQDLDVSDPANPAVATGMEVATYTTDIVLFEPSTVGLYPTATSATLTAMDNFTPGDNLAIAWTLTAGTVSDEVLVQVSDSSGNEVEIWDESFSGSTTSITVASSEFGSLDPSADSYDLLVRIYAMDEVTGQAHSTDYRATISSGGTPALTCGYESGWDDLADGGMGAPISPNSFMDFETVVSDCGEALTVTAANVVGTYTDGDETFTFDDPAGAAATLLDPATGVYTDGVETIVFQWWVDTLPTYIVIQSNDTVDPNLPAEVWFRETSALRAIEGSTYRFVKYSEQSNYSDTDRFTGSDGEIWYQDLVKQ